MQLFACVINHQDCGAEISELLFCEKISNAKIFIYIITLYDFAVCAAQINVAWH